MNRKINVVISILLMLAIAASITLTSLAWYSTYYVGTQSLDFAVFSKSIVTLTMDSTDFYADFRPARAYRGAVAAGRNVDGIFADPFYYSADGTSFEQATSAQLAARLALQYFDSTQVLEKDRYTLATVEQLLDNTVHDKIYYFTGLEYVPASQAQIAEGLCIYSHVGNSYARATNSDLEGPFIEEKAQIGVAEVRFDYYGAENESSLLTLSCQVLSRWPNAPDDSAFVIEENEEEEGGEGGESQADSSHWMKDVGDEVSYIICVAGNLGEGYVPSEKLQVAYLPDTTILVKNEAGTYETFTMEYPQSTMYLFTSNADHNTLYANFGINNYDKTVGYVEVQSGVYNVSFDETWAANNDTLATEIADGEGTFRRALYDAIQMSIATNAPAEFDYNSIGYAVERAPGAENGFNVYQTTRGIGQLVTTTTMNLQFYVFLWYNQVDELLSPNVTFGEVGLAITVDTTGE